MKSNAIHRFNVGVFEEGRMLWIINQVECTHAQAAVIVAILDLTKESLPHGAYFAVDYINRGLTP